MLFNKSYQHSTFQQHYASSGSPFTKVGCCLGFEQIKPVLEAYIASFRMQLSVDRLETVKVFANQKFISFKA